VLERNAHYPGTECPRGTERKKKSTKRAKKKKKWKEKKKVKYAECPGRLRAMGYEGGKIQERSTEEKRKSLTQ